MKRKPRLLDLFCGAGGCAMGYARAGFEVVGVDLFPQPRYPFPFIQADALTFLDTGDLTHFDALHASPPCQEYSSTRHLRKALYPHIPAADKLIGPVRARFEQSGLPWVIENVAHSPLPDALELCGSMFGLPIRRHRWFASSLLLFAPRPCQHTDGFYNAVGGKVRGYGMLATNQTYRDAKGSTRKREGYYSLSVGRRAMGIEWMTLKELSQAIPPAYTEWIGQQMMEVLP